MLIEDGAGGRARRRLPASRRSTGRPRATLSPRAWSSRCSRSETARKRLRPRLRGRARSAASRAGRPAVAADRAPEVDRRCCRRHERRRSCSTAIPGHDDAIAILLALGSDEVELLGVTTVAGNQTLEKTTANAIRVLELAGRGDDPGGGGRGPAARARAARRRRRPRRDRARRPGPATAAGRALAAARGRLPRRADRRHDARRHRPADERRAPARALPGGEAGADRADGRRDRRGQRHAGGRVQHLGRPGGRRSASSPAGST